MDCAGGLKDKPRSLRLARLFYRLPEMDCIGSDPSLYCP